MTLSFKDGYFYLETSVRHFTARPDEWQIVEPGLYRTTNLKEAAAFRSKASKLCEKVFDRAFVKFYGTPRLPSLLFLDPHQRDGLKWVLSRSRSYLAHPPGAGKTFEAIAAAYFADGPGQAVFIVPPSLTLNWEREIHSFHSLIHNGGWPSISIIPVSAKQEHAAWGADYIILPDSMLARDWVYEGLSTVTIKLLAVDEASRFKEPTTERAKAFYGGRTKDRTYHGLFQRARHTVFLDGSPMPNRPMELWAPTFALNPEAIDCMDRETFGRLYCGAKINDRGNWEFNHSSNEAQLKEKLQKDFMHVIPESTLKHPERRRSILFMNQDVRSAAHKTWERKHLTSLTMKEIDEDASQGDMAHFRRELGLKKVPWIARYVSDRLKEKSESILLFVWHREVARDLAKALKAFEPGVVIGGVANDEREQYFREFQAGKRRLIIGNISAMGRGHNLQRADRVIFGEFSWTDELNKQCEKRASRRGRDEQAFVRCEYIACPNSIDEVVLNSNFTKETRVRKVIG